MAQPPEGLAGRPGTGGIPHRQQAAGGLATREQVRSGRRRCPSAASGSSPTAHKTPDVRNRGRSALTAGPTSGGGICSANSTCWAAPRMPDRCWLLVGSGLSDEKHDPGGHQPERPGNVGDRDDHARKFPALFLKGADEFEGTDKEGEADRDAGPGEPGVEH